MEEPQSNPPKLGAIIGGIFGGIAVILLILIVFLWRKGKQPPEPVQPYTIGLRVHPVAPPSNRRDTEALNSPPSRSLIAWLGPRRTQKDRVQPYTLGIGPPTCSSQSQTRTGASVPLSSRRLFCVGDPDVDHVHPFPAGAISTSSLVPASAITPPGLPTKLPKTPQQPDSSGNSSHERPQASRSKSSLRTLRSEVTAMRAELAGAPPVYRRKS